MDKIPENRTQNFKAKSAFTPDELRRSHNELNVELRKQKREEDLLKRHNLAIAADSEESEDDETHATFDTKHEFYERLPAVMQGVMSDNVREQLGATTRLGMIMMQGQYRATSRFRRILQDRNPLIDEVIRCGVVPRIVEFLRSSHAAVQCKAAWALAIVASGSSAQTQYLIGTGAVPLLVELLSSPVADVKEQAVYALGNFAGDGPFCRDIALREQALTSLLGVFYENCNIYLLRQATWTLSNLCRGKKPPPDWTLISPALGVLPMLLHSSDDEVLANVCQVLSHLSDGPGAKTEAVVQSGVCHRLVELLTHPEASVQTAALSSICSIATGDELQTQAVIDCGALQSLLALLSSPKEYIREMTCWTISNITAGSLRQIKSVIEANLVPPLIDILKNADFNTRKQACWAILNATSNGEQKAMRVDYFVSQGCIEPLCDILTFVDNKIVQPTLQGLESILRVGEMEKETTNGVNQYGRYIEECGGMEKIRLLQAHDNPVIYETANRIIAKYFVDEKDDRQASLRFR